MKKILLTLSFALVTMYASAYFKVGNIYYQPDEQADDGTCWVRDSPYYGGYDGLTDITIPGRVTYNGREYRVTAISNNAFQNVTTLQRVRLGWGVKEISPYAFAGCTGLKYVFLPSTLTNIYNYAFQNCSSMTQMGVAAPTPPTLSTYALSGMKKCDIVTAIQTNASSYNAVTAWKNADSDGSVSYSGTKANDFVENNMCYVITSPATTSNNVDVTLVGISSGVTYLPMASSVNDYTNSTYGGGSYIFCNWTEIAPYAAYGHSTLRTIGRSDLGSYFRLKKVGAYAFNSCHALTEVNISAQEIDNFAFYNCSNLATVNLYLKGNESYGTKKLGERCFAKTAVTYQYIPQSLTVYGDGAFAMCSNLENFGVSSNNTLFETFAGWLCSQDYETIYQVGAANTRVGNGGFYGITRTIKPWCFAGCTATDMLKIPYGVTTIGNYAFYDANITSMLIPSSVTSVGSYAFCYMSYLEHLYYNKPTPTSGLSFTGLKSGCVLSVPYQSRSNYSSNSTWSSAFTGGIDGKAYDLSKLDDASNTRLYYTVTSVGSYTDPAVTYLTMNGQVKIVRGEMSDTYSGTIDIPMRYYSDNFNNFAITEIDYRAFYVFTSLKQIYGGDCLKTIGEEAFSTCLSLTTVNFHNLVSIGKDAFEDCTALSSFNMGNRLESIGVSSFINCKALTGEISLPATVTNIGASAFVNCTGLQSIFVNRTEATTFGRDFYPSSVEGFACYVPLNQFYDFYSKMKTNTYSSSPTTAPKKLLPWVKPTTQWTPISVPVDDNILLPATGEFYIATDYSRPHSSLVKTLLNNNKGIKGYEGMLLKGTVGTIYRFRRKTDVSNYTYVAPSNNILKGVTGASQTLTYTSAGPWYYTFNGSDRFTKVTSSKTLNSGSAYVQLSSDVIGPVSSVPAVYIENTATLYNLWINGVMVTSLNCSNLSVIDGVSGTVTYTPGTNTLKLSNATIVSTTSTDLAANIINQISDLKINVIGTNTLRDTSGSSASLVASESTSITGTGEVNFISTQKTGCRVGDGKTLTISGGAKVNISGLNYGLFGSGTTSKLVVSGATTKLTAKGTNNASIYRMKATLNNGLAITEPAGAYFNSAGTVVSSGGMIISGTNVVISKPTAMRGDVDNNGTVNISDVTALINYLLTHDATNVNVSGADCDQSGSVTISDVTVLINYLLTQSW